MTYPSIHPRRHASQGQAGLNHNHTMRAHKDLPFKPFLQDI